MLPRGVINDETNAKKTKVRFGRLLRHPAWKRSWSILKGKDISKGGDRLPSKEKLKKKDKWGSITSRGIILRR